MKGFFFLQSDSAQNSAKIRLVEVEVAFSQAGRRKDGTRQVGQGKESLFATFQRNRLQKIEFNAQVDWILYYKLERILK